MAASSSLPAALSRGARRNPTTPAVTPPGVTPATSMSAASPGRGALRRRPRPIVTRVRFSPTSGARSAMVPSATTSVSGRRASGSSTRAAPGSLSRAWASLNATPTPARCGHGAPGSFGVTTMHSGSAPSISWWSVTTTSMPSSCARATSSRAPMPQSTVTSSLTPSPASSSTVAAATP